MVSASWSVRGRGMQTSEKVWPEFDQYARSYAEFTIHLCRTMALHCKITTSDVLCKVKAAEGRNGRM